MQKQSAWQQVGRPVLAVLALMVVSYFGYFGSRHMANQATHQIVATVFGTAYFISIALGTIYVFAASRLRGAGLGLAVAACFVTPFVWMTKEVWRISESHPIVECLYYYLNPLNIWLVSFMFVEMGLAALIIRPIQKRRGKAPVTGPAGAIAVMLVSLAVAISVYAWGKGENIYVLFLSGYRVLFGSGV